MSMMKPAWFVLVLLITAAVHGQPPSAPAVVSPEVHPDRTVTFRIAAPKASEVTFTSDWLAAAQKMDKAADGVWSLTVGPLSPSTYIYSFTVDGVAMADPVNPRIKLRARGSGSLVDVPAESPALWEARDVPHGSVEINWQKSTVLNGETRAIWIYTPPGYARQPDRRYPVLYLLHGSNDTAAGWTTVGNANFILDNLLAGRQAVPMIIVMPFGHALPFGARGDGGGRRGGAAQPVAVRNNTTVFEEYLFKDVIPLVESNYRVAPGREQRALAGMSMGAEQSLDLFFRHLDQFSAIGAFCPAGFPALETDFPALLDDPKGTNARISVFWLGCGRQDPGHFPGSQRIDEVLTAHQIDHIWHPTEGVHNYALWRDYLIEFAPLLFRSK
jgi:enterochelin esterase family protein